MQVNQKIHDTDLGRALRDEQGTFLVQNRGQNFVAVSEEGHSIVSLRPIGEAVPVAQAVTSQDTWTITKISDSTDAAYESREQRRSSRSATS